MIDPHTPLDVALPPHAMDTIVCESCGKSATRTKT